MSFFISDKQIDNVTPEMRHKLKLCNVFSRDNCKMNRSLSADFCSKQSAKKRLH